MVIYVKSSVILGILLVVSVLLGHINSYHVLVLGDSYDRLMVKATCGSLGGNLTSWGDESLSYLDNQESSFRCRLDKLNISIASVMMFGSPATGPYNVQSWLERSHPTMIINTPERMRYAMDRYFSLFNQTPDVVFFHTTLWDFMRVTVDRKQYLEAPNSPGTKEFNQAVSLFYRSYQERLHELYGLLKQRGIERTTRIALRTAFEVPLHKGCVKDAFLLIGAINQAVSTLAEQMQLSLYDFNYEVESEFFGHYENCRFILNDDLHLHSSMSMSTGRKLAGLQYTNAMSWRPSKAIQLLPISDSYIPIILPRHAIHTHSSVLATIRTWKTLTNVSQDAFLVTDRHPRHFHNLTAMATDHSGVVPHLYFVTYVDGQPRRHGNVTLGFLELFRLGESDIASVGPKRLQSIPVSYAIPRSFQTLRGRFPDGVVARLVSESDVEALHASEEEVQSVCGSVVGDGALLSGKSFEYFHVVPGYKKPIVRTYQGEKLSCQDVQAAVAYLQTKDMVHVPWSVMDYLVPDRWIML